MSTQIISTDKILKFTGIAALTIGLNYVLKNTFSSDHKNNQTTKFNTQTLIEQRNRSYEKYGRSIDQYHKKNGTLKQFQNQQEDDLKKQLDLMTRAMCDFQKVSNLIVDLQLTDFKTYPCPFIAVKDKKTKQEPFLQPQSIVKPGTFLIKNCVFRSGQQLQNQKKYMRAGPRKTQFFNPASVRADIVVCGKICPGINTIIRELYIMLKQTYKVDKVYGVKNSFDGYYEYKKNKSSIQELQKNQVQTIHHHGGCFLGIGHTQCDVKRIVDNLIQRKINQVYLIGASSTFKSAAMIYQEIKKRKLVIGICVLLKAINKDVAIFDTCFGFQSAVEQSQRFIQMAYVSAKSYHHTVSLIKVPGWQSGFLASDAVKAARNVNICLVPEFPFQFYGPGGLLKYISSRIRHKGSCVIVYSEGACKAAIDIDSQYKNPHSFDQFFKKQIQICLQKDQLSPCNVLFMDTNHAVRSIPANSLDTKLCSQIAHSSIYGLMCGYTNFVCGHFAMRSGMVPLQEMMERKNKYQLRSQDQDWQRLLATTGQPNFLNNTHINQDQEKK